MNRQEWIQKCNHWKDKWPEIEHTQRVSNCKDIPTIYTILDAVNMYSSHNHVLVGDAGSISYAGPVALRAKHAQRFLFSPAQADMGWAVPGAIGVALASKKQVIAITGDGSFMSNLQELAVIKQHNLNIKIIIVNNNGYLSIKNTQEKYFQGRVYGTSDQTGLWFPNFETIAESFGFGYYNLQTAQALMQLGDVLEIYGPALVNCKCQPNHEILPAQAFKNGKQAGLHDMIPFLSDAELAEEMLVKLD